MPNLIFSNVIWGYLVRAIPQIHGVWGYSIATMGVIIIVGAVFLRALRKLSLGWMLSLSVVFLLLARPVLFPQFTINAGLLTLGAVVCWHLYGKQESRRALAIGCLLGFCGYLVRSQEFLLVLLIALPLLPWNKLLKDRATQFSAFALLLAVGVAAFVDYKSYQGDTWQAFRELNFARASITDFGYAEELKKNPEILSRHGYTPNDINLIGTWFFVDENIANPQRLNAMLRELVITPSRSHHINNGWIALQTFFHPFLKPAFYSALFLFLLFPSRKLVVVWCLCFAAFFLLGVAGRPGILHVYIPVISFLVISPLLTLRTWAGTRRWLTLVAIVLAAFFNTTAVFSQSRAAQSASLQARQDLLGFPEQTVVSWGSVFPYEAAYPVLGSKENREFSIYALGTFTLAPFSVAHAEKMIGRGMVERLLSSSGVPILANKGHFSLLSTYCDEHHGGVLLELASKKYGRRHLSWCKCEAKEGQR